MPTAIAMPKLGMTMTEGRVIEWPVPVGERVEKGQVVLVIESEKAEVEIDATASGVVRHIYVEPDQTVPCGTLLAALTDAADEPFDPEAFRREHERTAPSPARQAPAPTPATGEPGRAPAARPGRGAVTPAARRLARELGIDAAQVPGSGPGGRVTREDVEAWAERLSTRIPVADGVSLEVPEEGEGDPVLLLPGFGADVSAFARQVPALASGYRVRGVNPRGVGSSDAPETERYDISTAAADAAAVSGEPAHVVGASLGAAAALELALEHPERVRSLTLMTPFVRAESRLLAVIESWCQLAAEASPEALARALVPWMFSPALLADDGARERTVRGFAETATRVPAASLARWAAGLRAWSGTREGDLARIAVPTLVIAAGRDLLIPGAAALAEAIPRAKCTVVPEAGHAVGLEAPEAVNQALLAHLDAARD
jgi:pyruvate dehydrogenase E2 component (dihydrolipoamide acetyltransferase)